MNPDDYGWLRAHVEESEPIVFSPPDYGLMEKWVVVDQADPRVSAPAALIESMIADGYAHDGVLTIGTEGYGLGVVRYRISEHPAGPKYRVLTLEGTDRDR